MTKALGLYSGGLDSRLAVRLVRAAGLEVELLHAETGFGRNEVDSAEAEQAGGALHRLDVRERYLREVVVAPRYGYGARPQSARWGCRCDADNRSVGPQSQGCRRNTDFGEPQYSRI